MRRNLRFNVLEIPRHIYHMIRYNFQQCQVLNFKVNEIRDSLETLKISHGKIYFLKFQQESYQVREARALKFLFI